jgi:hypothetical protein
VKFYPTTATNSHDYCIKPQHLLFCLLLTRSRRYECEDKEELGLDISQHGEFYNKKLIVKN